MKLSRSNVSPDAPSYTTSTAVVMSELIKLLVSFYFLISSLNGSSSLYLPLSSNTSSSISSPLSSRRWIRILSAAWNDLFGPTSEYKKVLVPALLYYIQNNLQYIAVSLLDAATFQVTYQLKILTTALFSVGMLGKRPNFLEWVALVILTGGVALVQLPTTSSSSTSEADLEDNMNAIDSSSSSLEAASRLMGLMAVIIACVLSGLAGVWFEKVLKGSKASLWVRNTQLALFSLIIGFISGVFVFDRQIIHEKGFFYGYTGWTWSAILCQAVGGLIVAMVVKYADNILKGFATSVSIVLSSVLSIYLFDFQVTTSFMFGASLVLYSTYLYQCEGMKKSAAVVTDSKK